MANRHLSRSLALQSLFEWDFKDCEQISGCEPLPVIVWRNAREFAPGLDDPSFVNNLVEGVVKERTKLDEIIEKAAPDWPMDQIAIVDRNVLRLGLYEMIFGNAKEVPARVAINESIELAKTFGGENSGRFVNGVLGAVYKELGEPGKGDVPVKKTRIKDVPYDQMPIQKLAGAMVYCRDGKEIYLALVHDVFGYWTLSKGKMKPGEDLRVGTARKIKEELSLKVAVQDELAYNEYIASDPEQGKLRKQVNYFLAEAKGRQPLKLEEEKGGLTEAKWFPAAEVADLRIYDDVVPIIVKGIGKLYD